MSVRSLARRLADSELAAPARRLVAKALQRSRITAWARLHTGQRLRVELRDSVGRSIWLRGTYEPEVESQLRRVLRPGDCFIDVGANVGYFSLVASPLVGPTGAVHCFEANPAVCSMLRDSIAANALLNVTLNASAVWNRTGAGLLRIEPNPSWSFIQEGTADGTDGLTDVPLVALDDYFAERRKQRIRLIKMDIEGAEVHALRGARGILASHGPCLILEAQSWCLQRFGHDLAELFALLGEFGYRAWDLRGTPVAGAEAAARVLAAEWTKNLVFEQVA